MQARFARSTTLIDKRKQEEFGETLRIFLRILENVVVGEGRGESLEPFFVVKDHDNYFSLRNPNNRGWGKRERERERKLELHGVHGRFASHAEELERERERISITDWWEGGRPLVVGVPCSEPRPLPCSALLCSALPALSCRSVAVREGGGNQTDPTSSRPTLFGGQKNTY